MSQATLSILQAPEVIAVNQDPLGIPADLVWKEGPEEVRQLFCHGDHLAKSHEIFAYSKLHCSTAFEFGFV